MIYTKQTYGTNRNKFRQQNDGKPIAKPKQIIPSVEE